MQLPLSWTFPLMVPSPGFPTLTNLWKFLPAHFFFFYIINSDFSRTQTWKCHLLHSICLSAHKISELTKVWFLLQSHLFWLLPIFPCSSHLEPLIDPWRHYTIPYLSNFTLLFPLVVLVSSLSGISWHWLTSQTKLERNSHQPLRQM